MTRRSLGRGLDALIDNSFETERDSAGGSLLLVAPDRITPSPFQPRRYFDAEKLHDLAEAIRHQGIIEPLIVRPSRDGADGTYELIAGERRLRAAREVGLAAVPVVVRELDDRAALEMSLVENLAREDLNAVEEGRAFIRLNREFGLSHDEIAGRIGKSRPYVTNTARLLELPVPVVTMIERGDMSAGQARPLLSMTSPDEQLAAALRIANEKISARGAEELAVAGRPAARTGQGIAKNCVEAPVDANLGALAQTVQRALKRKVVITKGRGRKAGRIELEYYNNDDLSTLSRMLIVAGRAVHGEEP
jgi:ParB family transcriptional regulator, chromosome partitioning protein